MARDQAEERNLVEWEESWVVTYIHNCWDCRKGGLVEEKMDWHCRWSVESCQLKKRSHWWGMEVVVVVVGVCRPGVVRVDIVGGIGCYSHIRIAGGVVHPV